MSLICGTMFMNPFFAVRYHHGFGTFSKESGAWLAV